MERPLRDDVARPVRAYLVALVAGAEVSDAWHELLSDVGYWGERDLLPVLRLAHQVVLQHERVAPEVAALALSDVGVDDPADVAVVLDADVPVARRWVEQARASKQAEAPAAASPAPGRFADRPRPDPAPAPATRTPAPDPTPAPEPPASDPQPDAEPVASDPQPDAEPVASDLQPAAEAVRIGFDEDDGPLPDLDGPHGPRAPGRLVAWMVALLVVVLAGWGLVVR